MKKINSSKVKATAHGVLPDLSGTSPKRKKRSFATDTKMGENSPFKYLGPRLRDWRISRGLKIATASLHLGVSTATWCHWETGRRTPNSEMLALLIQYTGISIEELICPGIERCPFLQKTQR